MNKLLLKMSRRDRLMLLLGGVVLFLGVVVYPGLKKAEAYREESIEMLESDLALLGQLQSLEEGADRVEKENKILKKAFKGTDDLLFPPLESKVIFQSKMMQKLNELGPDLDLEVESGRSTVSDAATRVNLSLRGRGRYSAVLNFIHKVEMYRPVIIVDSLTVYSPEFRNSRRPSGRGPGGRGGGPGGRGPGGRGPGGRGPSAGSTSDEGTMSVRMTVHINCREAEQEQTDEG